MTEDEIQAGGVGRRGGAGLRRRPGAQAQMSDGVIKIGVLNDMSGLYADVAGPGSVRRRADGGRGLRRRHARA